MLPKEKTPSRIVHQDRFGNLQRRRLRESPMATVSRTQKVNWTVPRPLAALCRLLASLKLAVILLIVLAAVLGWATFVEAAYGPEFTRWYVYGSRWFIALLATLAVNVLAATLSRYPWKRRQIGFLVTHAGILVLLAGSMQTYLGGIEGRLVLGEGETADSILLAHRSRIKVAHDGSSGRLTTEFSFSPGPRDWQADNPLDFGPSGGVRLKILEFYRHARRELNWVADDSGLGRPALKLPRGQTTAPEAAALVELTVGGKTQEVWLIRTSGDHESRPVETPSGTLELSFGYEHLPLGFSLKLLDFKRGMNPGKMGDASFASEVQLIDKSRGVNQRWEISMNNPLVHGKFSFYQSSFSDLPGGAQTSILSVAHDPGGVLKYTGSVMICVGIFIMYYLKTHPKITNELVQARFAALAWDWFCDALLIAAVIASMAVGASAFAGDRHSDDFDWQQWQRLPVLDDGRYKPLDTLARETLRTISGRGSFTDPATGAELNATAFYLMTLLGWQAAQQRPDPHATLGMGTHAAYFATHRPDKWDRAELLRVDLPALRKLLGMADKRTGISPQELTQAKIRNPQSDEETSFISWVAELSRGNRRDLATLEERALRLVEELLLYETHRMGRKLYVLPLAGSEDRQWVSVRDLLQSDYDDETDPSGGLRKAKEQFAKVRTVYSSGSSGKFNQASAAFITTVKEFGPKLGVYPKQATIDLEIGYNRTRPFRFGWVLCVLASFFLILSTGWKSRPLHVAGWASYVAAMTTVVVGFALRTSISGRAPVTNLYESVVFMGFGTLVFGLIFALLSRKRYICTAAAVVAAVALVLADNCPSVLNPGIRPLQPVLRSNLWLAVHVITIMLSYAALALALGIGNVTLGYYLVGSKKQETIAILARFTYKSLQAGILLLVVGTFLGAAWADYSWGRFWGWDPKEVWALITLLGYLAVVHGRCSGWIGNHGLAVWSVGCFAMVVMAWYGVNLLGTGLHNYGFGGDGAEYYVFGAVLVQLLYVAAASARYSAAKRKTAPAAEPSGP